MPTESHELPAEITRKARRQWFLPHWPRRGIIGEMRRGADALHHPDYRLVWFGQFARGTSQWIQMTTIPLLVLHFGGSAFHLGLVTAVQFGPVLVIAPIGGVIADRLPKQRVLMTLQAVLAAQALALAIVAAGGDDGLVAVLVLAAVFGLANSLEMPIRHSFLATLLPEGTLANGIVLAQAAYIVTRLVAPVLASLVLLVFGFWVNFILGAIGAVVTLGLLSRVRALGPSDDEHRPRAGIVASLRAGVRYAVEEAPIAWSLGLLLAITVGGMSFQALLPLYADLVLGDDRGYGLLLSALAIGGLFAALPMMYVRPTQAMPLGLLGGVGLAALLVVLASTRMVAVALVALTAIGFSFLIVTASVNVMVQHSVTEAFRGRVMGLYVAILNGGAAIGGLLAGAAAEVAGTPTTILATAFLTLAALAVTAARRTAAQAAAKAK